MSRSSKKKSERNHAKRKARERFGESFSNEDLNDMIKKIKDGSAEFLEKQSLRLSLFRVDYNGHKYRVVYDRERKEIVTFLPSEEDVESYRKILRGK